MSTLDTGTYGAKRQSFRKASPRDLLKTLIESNPRLGEQKLRALFADRARGDEDQIDAIIEYWFANNYRSLIQRPDPGAAGAMMAERAQRVEKVKQAIKVAATRMVLLDMVLPTGKALRDSTGKDCAKAGGWLAKLANSVKPSEKIGAVLSETQVRKIFQAA